MYFDRDQWGVFGGKIKLAYSCQRALPMALLSDDISQPCNPCVWRSQTRAKNYKSLRQSEVNSDLYLVEVARRKVT